MPAALRAEPFRPLRGVTVLERAGPLCVAACTHLLVQLGARVVRMELPEEQARLAAASPAERRLRIHGKERVALDARDCVDAWRGRLPAADVVVLAPPDAAEHDHAAVVPLLDEANERPVVCVFSLAGLGQPAPPDAPDALAQALGGLMAVTGAKGGAPEFVRVPVAQLSAAAIGVTSIAAALAQRSSGTRGACIDLALVEIMADQLRTHIGLVERGRSRGFRIGCEHPLCAPWNAYRARDGWIVLCSSGDAHWRALAQLMGEPALARAERFATMQARREHGADIDAIVQAWVAAYDRDAVIALLNAAGIPAGPALAPRDVPHAPVLREAGTVRRDVQSGRCVPSSPWRFRRTQVHAAQSAMRARSRRSAAAGMPLAGMRVVEITRYAAGPLAGFVLASLGAEVIKIEPRAGEECRGWSPQFGNVSGYFAAYNAGKRALALDLRAADDRRAVERLIADADVLLHNMRPGAMERLGLDADRLCGAHPRLVYCAISGFGPAGPQLPALDTVIQAQLGLTALVGDGSTPLRVGYSIADQLAGHFAAAGIVAALLAPERAGGVLDVAMVDALAWLTHLAWDGDAPALPETARAEAADGWIVAAATQARVQAACPDARALTRAAAVARLSASGIAAAPVLEIDEVLQHPTLVGRRSLCRVPCGADARAPVFAAPLGMAAVRPAGVPAFEDEAKEWNDA
jgi:crotonobetainyl-CoA:carnitine CoA-transferase CaiB-like acyl-CoA transferase